MDPRLRLRLRLLLRLETSSWYCVMKLSRVSFRRFFFCGQLGEGGHLRGEYGITHKHTHTNTSNCCLCSATSNLCLRVFVVVVAPAAVGQKKCVSVAAVPPPAFAVPRPLPSRHHLAQLCQRYREQKRRSSTTIGRIFKCSLRVCNKK